MIEVKSSIFGRYARVKSLGNTLSLIPNIKLRIGDIVRVEGADPVYTNCYLVYRERQRFGLKRLLLGEIEWSYHTVHPADLEPVERDQDFTPDNKIPNASVISLLLGVISIIAFFLMTFR